MTPIEEEIRNAIKLVQERGLTLPGREGGGQLDRQVVEDLLKDAFDDTGEANPFVLAFARQIVAAANQ